MADENGRQKTSPSQPVIVVQGRAGKNRIGLQNPTRFKKIAWAESNATFKADAQKWWRCAGIAASNNSTIPGSLEKSLQLLIPAGRHL
jgi:ABC-type Fe3+-citrate transport system substrate-binding protein